MNNEITTHRGIWLLALLLLLFGNAKAQQKALQEDSVLIDKHADRVFKIHPLQVGEVYVSYEKLRANNVSNEFGLSYIYKAYLNGDGYLPQDHQVTGLAIRMSQRHYNAGRSGKPYGFFHGPLFGYRFIVFEKDVFGLAEVPPNDPNYRFVGRFYQNALELSYQVGGQLLFGKHFALEISGALGGRVKYALATGAGDLLEEKVIGYAVVKESNSLIAVVPSPQLNIALGYTF